MATVPITKTDLESALPDTSSSLSLRGLENPLELYRDRYGIPHVKAQSAHDAFFGQGFVTAQDRLWQMDYDRRRAYGRWAEYSGRGGVDQDLMMRRFQIGPTVEADYKAVNADTRAMLDAYTDGVNAFIDSTEALPIEYRLVGGRPETWRPWDCLAIFKVRHILMGRLEQKMWRARLLNGIGPERAAKLLKGYPTGQLLVVPPGVDYDGPMLDGLDELTRGLEAVSWLKHDDAGSNNWVLDGGRTASGLPLMAGDPHRGLETPNVYYQNHIACLEFDIVGLSFPGCPGFPHFGHSASVAWCVTHAGADYQDLYVERFDAQKPRLYEFEGEWREAEVHHETVQVRGDKPVELDVTVTHHGPVVAGDPAEGYGIAFKYTATAEVNRGSEAILKMMKATTVDQMDEAMRPWVDPCNNFLFADVDGSIAYLNRGVVPIRSMDNAWLPVPGWSGKHEWQGAIPFEELARIRNPDTGYIVTANNRIVGHDYPYYISLDYAPEYRARRVLDRIEGLTRATVEDMRAVHGERVSIPARTYLGILSEVEAADDLCARALEKLRGWDATMDPDAVAPTIYSAFRYRLHRAIAAHLLDPILSDGVGIKVDGQCVEDQLRLLWSLLEGHARERDTSMLPPGEDWGSLSAKAFAEGMADLKQALGDDVDSWRWGRVHHTRPRHTLSSVFPELAGFLDPPQVEMGGDGETPQAAGYCTEEPFVVAGMSVSRYVFDLGDWSNSAWVSPLGASGHPGSRHYTDQVEVWGDLRLVPMLYDWQRIVAESEGRQELEPR